MAFPWIFYSNFEAGTNAEWTSETDTASQLDIAHITTLASVSGRGSLAPFRGAYCARWRLGANTTDAFLTSTGIDIADAATSYFRWYIYFGHDFTFTANDVVSLFKLTQAGGGTVEYTVGINCVASTGDMFLGGSDGTAAAAFGTSAISRGVWHSIEVLATVSTSDAGVITTWLDGVQQTTADTLDQGAAVGDGVLGVMDRLSTTTGTVLMDDFIQDDARIYPIVDRFPRQLLLTKSAHAFIGPGEIENVSLLSGAGTDNVLTIYDTNRANTNAANKIGIELKNVTNNDIVDPAGVPVLVTRGAYVVLAGTNPRAMINIKWAPGYGSAGAARTVAARLRTRPLEVL
jgi:hypothetical protein